MSNGAKQELDLISAKLRSYSMLRVQISTHSDNSLSLSDAKNLIEKQAISIAGRGVDKGIPNHRLAALAYGSSRPFVLNTSAAAQKTNRCVENLPLPVQ